jgi:mono/diheme cytochrome c family protein
MPVKAGDGGGSIVVPQRSFNGSGEAHMQAAKILVTLVLVAGTTAAGAQEVGDARKGLRFAERVCAECHAVKAGQYPVPAAGPTFKTIANTPGMTAMALTVFFRTSHRDMPNLVLSESDRDDVIAYILSLKESK